MIAEEPRNCIDCLDCQLKHRTTSTQEPSILYFIAIRAALRFYSYRSDQAIQGSGRKAEDGELEGLRRRAKGTGEEHGPVQGNVVL